MSIQPNWNSLHLKYEESDYFLNQMAANNRQPKLFLFYLSAFLSSARSLTFHIQKIASNIGHKQEYNELREKFISDNLCGFFVDLRNQTEKEGFIDLAFECNVRGKFGENLPEDFVIMIHCLEVSRADSIENINDTLQKDWDKVIQYFGKAQSFDIKPRWYFYNAPHIENAATNDAIELSTEYLKRLWYFLIEFRQSLKNEQI